MNQKLPESWWREGPESVAKMSRKALIESSIKLVLFIIFYISG
jgi:hypothetical protein